MTAPQSIAQRQPLIEIAHQLDFLADSLADDLDRRQIIGEAVPTETQLKSGEPAFLDKCFGFLTEGLHLGRPESVAVVGGYRAERSAQKDRQRHAGCLSQCVPRSHVEPCHRDQRHPFPPDKLKRGDPFPEEVEGSNFLTPENPGQVLDRRNQVACGRLEVRFEVAAPDDPLFRIEVDEDNRPIIERPDL